MDYQDKMWLYDIASALETGFDSVLPEDFTFLNEYVAAKIEQIPDQLITLVPYDQGEKTLNLIQNIWIRDFWESRKKLSS